VPFDEIAPIVDRSPEAARQLASRARRRVRGQRAEPDVDLDAQREVVAAFLAAAREGDFEALLAVLDPDVVLRGDAAAYQLAGSAVGMRGAGEVAGFFKGKAHACVPGLIEGEVGILLPVRGEMFLVLELTFSDGRIAAIDAVADRGTLATLELERLDWKTR